VVIFFGINDFCKLHLKNPNFHKKTIGLCLVHKSGLFLLQNLKKKKNYYLPTSTSQMNAKPLQWDEK
jgi:hypothetical protein